MNPDIVYMTGYRAPLGTAMLGAHNTREDANLDMSISHLEEKLENRLKDREARSQLRRLSTFPATSVDFSSNSYLSLSSIPELRNTYLAYLEQLASTSPPSRSFFGSGGSRLLDGNSTLAESLECEIAGFHNAPAGLLFNSGFDANVGLLSCVPQPGDMIVYDELIHASAHDGMKMSRAGQRMAFRHNTISPGDDDVPAAEGRQSLSQVLATLTSGEGGREARDGLNTVFVVVEAVYSMDGDMAPLREIVACVRQQLPRGNGRLIVDEAHSTGLFGRGGRGLVSELGLEGDVFARLHTFGKAMGSSGAIILCAPVVREYLVNYSRTLIYTTAMPPACLAGIKVTYDFLATDRAEALRVQLRQLTAHAHALLLAVCARRAHAGRHPPLVRVDAAVPRSPILALLSSRPRSLALYCQQRGFVVRPIVAPTVPVGSERVRVCLHAGNSREEVEGLARAVEAWAASVETGERSVGLSSEDNKARL